ncbi:MAG: hypothetical protein WBB39_00320 [Candidatus Saccharimonadales bacterium]
MPWQQVVALRADDQPRQRTYAYQTVARMLVAGGTRRSAAAHHADGKRAAARCRLKKSTLLGRLLLLEWV